MELPEIRKSVRLQTYVIDTDLDDGSQEGTWTTQATLLAHIHGSGKGQNMAFRREGLTREVHLLMRDTLAIRISGHRLLSDFLNAPDTGRVRFLADNRTLTFSSLEGDLAAGMGTDVVRLTCIETPQPIGYVDE